MVPFAITNWRRKKTYRANPPSRDFLNDRQEQVEGYDLGAYQRATILTIGDGGLGSHINRALTKKGVGTLYLMDDDRIAPPDLTRQDHSHRHIGQFKVNATAKLLAEAALFPLTIIADRGRFQERCNIDRPLEVQPDLIICGVDNNPTRRCVATYAHVHRIPLIMPAVGRDANAASVFVQTPEHACWGCGAPQLLNDSTYPCGLPGTFDVLAIAIGLTLHAADSIIANRPRHWNYREVYLDGALPDRTRTIPPRPDCPICSKPTRAYNPLTVFA